MAPSERNSYGAERQLSSWYKENVRKKRKKMLEKMAETVRWTRHSSKGSPSTLDVRKL